MRARLRPWLRTLALLWVVYSVGAAPAISATQVVDAAEVQEDSDGDGLTDAEEERHGTDPYDKDTDGDYYWDGDELENGFDPLDPDSHPVRDSDGDGFTNTEEIEAATDPTDSSDTPERSRGDSDGDGLSDREERERGTDVDDPDTDGDKLLDGWEVAGETPAGVQLPGSDPLQMDIYVEARAGANAQALTGEEIDKIETAWAEMPVENPDGTTGIDLHVDQRGKLDAEVIVNNKPDYEQVHRQYYTRNFMGDRMHVYHLVLLVSQTKAGAFDGRADAPGWFGVVVDDNRHGADGYTYRAGTFTHELLHNVMGRLSSRNQCPSEFEDLSGKSTLHSCEGWLSYDGLPSMAHLPEPLANEIEWNGFE